MTQMQRPGKRRSRWYGGGRRGWPLVRYGMIWFGIGVVITVATYAFAVGRGGGTYLVSYGPMAVGLVAMVRGGIDMARGRRAGGPAFAQAPGYEARPGAMPDAGRAGGMRPGPVPVAGGVPGGGAGMRWPGSAAGEPAYGMRDDAQERAYGSREQAYGSREQAYGSREPAYDSREQAYGPRQAGDPRQGPRNDPRQAGPGHAPGPAPAGAPPPNWYPDPRDPAILRWWDGRAWTGRTRPAS